MDEYDLGAYVPHSTYERLPRCTSPNCIVRWKSGEDRPCSGACWLAAYVKQLRTQSA